MFGGEDSEEVVETNIDDEDQFSWLWNPMCDIPVHVHLACLQVYTCTCMEVIMKYMLAYKWPQNSCQSCIDDCLFKHCGLLIYIKVLYP